MKRPLKRVAIILVGVTALLSLLFAPGLPWSARNRHKIKRAITKAEMTWARWIGNEPRLVSIAGRVEAEGIRIEALDSRSGWTTLTDKKGDFVLPDVMWYPGANYQIVVSTDESKGKLIEVSAPDQFPDGGLFDAGGLNLSKAQEVDLSGLLGLNATYRDYDAKNADYYEELFNTITADKDSDKEKVAAINKFVATKFNTEETRWDMGSPRRVLEQGSRYCGHLSAAMATLLEAGNYRTRGVYMSDGKAPLGTHIVVEVFYGGAWHLYDPMFGVGFENKDGIVASYREIRLNPDLISEDSFSSFDPKVRQRLMALLPGIFSSGYHHFIQIRNGREKD